MTNTIPKYFTVKQLSEHYPCFTQAAARYYIFHKDTNGMAPCLRYMGKKILIDRDLFEQWIDGHKTEGEKACGDMELAKLTKGSRKAKKSI